MLSPIILAAAAAALQPAGGEPARPASLNPSAGDLFDRDPELKAWALRVHESNHDGWLTLYEAQRALESMKDIADADRNGRVTVREYEAARQFIRARWGPARE